MIIKSSPNSKKNFHFSNLQKVDFVTKCYKFNKRLSYCKYNGECNDKNTPLSKEAVHDI